MIWIAPSESGLAAATLASRFQHKIKQAVPAPRPGLNAQECFGSRPQTLLGIIFLCLVALLHATTACAADTFNRHQWTVGGITREALVYVPSRAHTNPTPIMFAFHGHGGSMRNAARTFSLHTRWPEAIVVYPQGLNTPGRLTDPEGKKSGWQSQVGDQGDRDLRFFDVLLASLKQDYKVDGKRLYATGHSNGGGFSYLLWAARGDQFAAFAPSAAVAARDFAKLKPKPVLHVAGEQDALVKFAWQQQMMDALRKLNQCGEGKPWEGEKGCTLYPSKAGAPVVRFIHPGTHQFPAAAPDIIVKFFQQHALP